MTREAFPPHIEHCLKLQDDLDKLLVKRVFEGSLKDVAKWTPESAEEISAWDRLTDPENLDALKEIVHAMLEALLPASAALWNSALTDCIRREFISRSKRGRNAFERVRHQL